MNQENVKVINFQNKIWIDIKQPSKKQLIEIQQKFNLHDADIKSASDRIAIPKTFAHRHYLFIAMYIGELSQNGVKYHEIDIFFSKKYIITIHEHQIDMIDDLYLSLTNKKSFKTIDVLYEIIKYASYSSQAIADQIAGAVKNLEDELVTSHNEETIRRILEIRRQLIELSSIAQPNLLVTREITHSQYLMTTYSSQIVYFDSLVELQEKNFNLIRHYHDLINGITDTANILANFKFNDIIRVLTIVSVSLLPLSLIAGILGMNFKSSIFNASYGFVVTILLMIALVTIIIQYFRYKKWL